VTKGNRAMFRAFRERKPLKISEKIPKEAWPVEEGKGREKKTNGLRR